MTGPPLNAAMGRLAVGPPPQHHGTAKWKTTPPSTVVGGNRLHDISEHFRAAAAELAAGELVKDADFTLFESVGALEIMDPRMDSGCLMPGETLEDKYDVARNLLPEEIIGIMDQMLCCEMAWHEGYPLSQTVFSSHYVDKMLRHSDEANTIELVAFCKGPILPNTDSWVQRVMRSYCAALVKCCDLSLETITQSGHFYEEEDFSTHTYGRNLLQKIHESEISKILLASIDEIRRHENHVLREALIDRLQLRSSILSAMSCQFNEGRFEGDSASVHWRCIQTLATKIAASHGLGKPVKDSFSPKIQRRLASTQPPRPLVELKFEDAISKLQIICRDCIETERIIALRPQSAEQLKVLLMAFSSRQPEPFPYSRACLTRSVLSEGDEGFGEIFKVDLRETVAPADPFLDPYNWTIEAPLHPDGGLRDLRYECAASITSFTNMFTASMGGYIDIFRALLSNRCRLRRNLCHVVRTFDTVQQVEARQLDENLNRLSISVDPIQTWTAFQQLRLMALIVQLGFELEVFLADEMCVMYWYLGQILGKLDSEYCRGTLNEQLVRLRSLKAASSISVRDEIDRAHRFVRAVGLHCQASLSLTNALSSLYQTLSYLSLIPQPRRPADDERWEARRWELRMKPFLHVRNPPSPPYQLAWVETHPHGDYPQSKHATNVDVKQLVQQLGTVDFFAREAHALFLKYEMTGPGASFASGSEDFWNKDVAGCLASCLGVLDATAILRRASQELQLDTLQVEVNAPGKWHSSWIVPVIHGIPS